MSRTPVMPNASRRWCAIPMLAARAASLGDGGVTGSPWSSATSCPLCTCDKFLSSWSSTVSCWQYVTVSLSVSTASLEGPRSAGSFATTSLQASEVSVTCGVSVPDGRGSEALEGCGTSVPTSCKVLVSEGERDRDLDFRIALKRRPCSAEVEAEVPKFRAARAIRRAAKSNPVASSALMA